MTIQHFAIFLALLKFLAILIFTKDRTEQNFEFHEGTENGHPLAVGSHQQSKAGSRIWITPETFRTGFQGILLALLNVCETKGTSKNNPDICPLVMVKIHLFVWKDVSFF